MQSLIALAYLAAAVLFIVGLKLMSHPRTAARGNLTSAAGMFIAVVMTCLDPEVENYLLVAAGLALGGAIGAWLALRVQMTAMPQMVALLNGLGGGASALVAWSDLVARTGQTADTLTAVGASGLIGAVTFWGSLVAYAKLEELKGFRKPISFPGQRAINAVLLLGCLALTATLVAASDPTLQSVCYLGLVALASVLGVFLVNPIGGADMPVVISLMNSYSGLAGAATGFVIDNNALIISGSLVGASGVILTQIMCKAMNRSLFNVLFGVMGGGGPGASTEEVYATVRSTTPEEVAMLLDGAQRVVIVPGYGLAVSQAQHAVRTLHKILEDRGCTVEYAIHPVAGRMPGHMNVLLAEADVPYEQLKEMEEINPTLATADMAIVIGANDVVNPVARTDPQSPIAGMPIIDVDKARTVVVVKRSLSPGFAGIPNPLFAADNTLMLFADAQKGILEINAALRDAGK